MKSFAIPLFLLGFALLAACAPAAAPDADAFPTPSEDQVNALAREMYCPICENVPLDVCDTPACADWRSLIRQKLAEGWSERQIKEYFVTQYGDRVLAEPPARGFNWLAYLVPPAAFLAGIFLLLRLLKAKNLPAPSSPPLLPPEDPLVKRLEDELKNRER